tara:strand:- start:243 stop:1286 length:1044 start_codon:yes stop_codon:yes gene_type:complete
MKSLLPLFFIFLFFQGFSQNNIDNIKNLNEKKYNTRIIGTIENVKDSTVIYLGNFYFESKYMDSTLVKNGKFNFNFNSKEPFLYSLSAKSKDGFNGKVIIIAPGITKISINNSDEISKLKILEGSEETFEYERYFEKNGYKRDIEYIKQNPQSFTSLKLLYELFQLKSLPKKELTKIFNSQDGKYKNSQFAIEIKEMIANNFEAKKGVMFPNFKLFDKNGNIITLNDFKGKYLLIEFTASWCGPCKEQIPFQKTEYTKYQDKNFEILHIYLDDKEKMIKAIEKDSIPWINGYDNMKFKSKIAKKISINSIPKLFLLDPSGKIIEDGVFPSYSLIFEGLSFLLSKYLK